MSSNNMILNRLFTLNSLNELLHTGGNSVYSAVIKRYIVDPENKQNGELISEIYRFMSRSYRNEYFYENTLLNKLLIGKHKPRTTTALAQIPVGKSIADFILINGKAVVYEIKTELDSFDRLGSQVSNYYEAFSRVCVVTSESQFNHIARLLSDSPVGIVVITKEGSISSRLKKEPVENTSQLDHDVVFNVLRKKEFETILLKYYKTLPIATPAFYYAACQEKFKLIPILEAYQMALKELKKRNQVTYELLKQTPQELRSLVYFSKPNTYTFEALDSFLESKFGG